MSDSAVFLDRDGVINEIIDRHGVVASPRDVSELRIDQDAPEALRALRQAGYRLFVVTNQPDVSRGLMSQAALDRIHAALLARLPIEQIQSCTHDNADNCACRKPKPGLILELGAQHDIDLAHSWMIGDQDRDVACGRSAGVTTILLRRPYNSGQGADYVVSGLAEAATLILATPRGGQHVRA
jgi:D-glycero-D-manno-heptose 1,7-bisphosphate phosphatase